MNKPMHPDPEVQALMAKMYAKPFFVVLRTLSDASQLGPNLKAHIEYLTELEKAGRLLASGPFPSEDGPPDGGLTIVRGEDIDEVKALIETDPLISSGAFTCTVYPWVMNEGRITLQVDFSNSQFEVL